MEEASLETNHVSC